MRKGINIVSAVWIFVLLTFASCNEKNGRTYYLDATGGNDNNSGVTASQAWKSLEKVNGMTFGPGDKLLLKKGEVFSGQLEIKGKGTPTSRIVIDTFGEAEKNPCIMGNDTSLYAVRIYNSDYLTIQNLEIVNTGKERLAGRTGLKIECCNYGTSHNIQVRSLYIRDVNGSLVKEEGGGCGILIVNHGEEIKSRFDSLLIENCHISRCARNAMIWEGYSDRRNWYPSTHTIVRNNLIEGVPGDGIVPIGCDSTLIEYNVMRDCPEILPSTEAAAGIWPWSCDNTIIQFNEVSGHKAPWDAQGYDCDYNCRNTLIQYNYSHDNYGGLVLVCNSGTQKDYNIGNENSIVRYNISIGDGIRPTKTRAGMFSPSIHVAGPVKNTLIEHNIIHVNAKPDADIDRTLITSDSWDGYADSTIFRNNLFYVAEQSRFRLTESTHNLFVGNWYLGKYEQQPVDGQKRTKSALYVNEVLNPDANGYVGLLKLMDERVIGGTTHHFVNAERIKDFFERLEEER